MVSFELDSFITDKDKTFWSALLSNGKWVYQDDDRPGEIEKRAWVRLMQYCEDNEVYVTQMRIRFRSHEETMPESTDGYFCRNRVLGAFGAGGQASFNGYALGPVIDNKLHIQVWQIPEIILDEITPFEIRDIEGNEDAIIWNKKSNSYLQTQMKSVQKQLI